METSSSWPWLHEVLSGAGIDFVLAHARRLRAIAEANYKRDEIDAELLARMQLAGCIPPVYPTPFAQREWATLIRHRTALVMQRTAVVNRLHAQLHQRGLHLERGRLLTRAGRQWLKREAWPALSLEQRAVVRSHLRIIRGLGPLIRALDRRIAEVAASIPEAQLLRTIPGIGAHRALIVCAEALPIGRFRTPGHLASYAGELRGPRPDVAADRAAPGAPWADSGGGQSLAPRRARARGRLACATRAGQLAHALLPHTETAARLARGARRDGAEAHAGDPRHAPHHDTMD